MPCTLVWTSFERALTSLGLALVRENHHQMALAGTNDSSTEKGKQVACYRTNWCANCSAPILGIHGSHMAAIAQSWRGRAGRRWLRRTQATFLRRPTCQELAIFTNLDLFSLLFIVYISIFRMLPSLASHACDLLGMQFAVYTEAATATVLQSDSPRDKGDTMCQSQPHQTHHKTITKQSQHTPYHTVISPPHQAWPSVDSAPPRCGVSRELCGKVAPVCRAIGLTHSDPVHFWVVTQQHQHIKINGTPRYMWKCCSVL